MYWTVSTQHKDFFQEYGYILFEDLTEIEAYPSLKEWSFQKNFIQGFLSGRDYSVDNQHLRKFVTRKRWARIFGELIMIKTLRFGFDQLFIAKNDPNEKPIFPFDSPHSLSELSYIQGILGGALFCLSPSDIENEIVPKPGSVLFFNKTFSLPLNLFSKATSGLFLLIAYCENKSVYIFNEKDPHTHHLKKYGLNFNDRLKDKYHPIVYLASTSL